MIRDEHTTNGARGLSPAPPRHLISRLHLLLDRPVVLGLVAVLVSILCGGAIAGNSTFSAVKSHHGTAMTRSAPHPSSARSDEIPVLFLTLMGLAALALSQTRSTSEITSRPVTFAQAKKSSAGKTCPGARG